MNIQKVGVLLAMAAVFSASKAKSETTSPDTMRDVFQKPVISAVSTGDLVYTLRPDAQLEIPTTKLEIVDNKVVEKETTEVQKYPLQVQSEGTGFAFNFNKDGKCPDFSSMAYNENSDTLFIGLNGNTNICYTLDKASQRDKLSAKKLSEKNLMDSSENKASFMDTPLYMISYDNTLLAFIKNTKIGMRTFQINGDLKIQKTVFLNAFKPEFDCQTENYIYISDGEKTAKINKKNPSSIDIVEQPTSFVSGMTAIKDQVIFTNGNIIYSDFIERLSGIENIHSITTDGKTLYVAADTNKSTTVTSSAISTQNIPTKIITGTKKIIPYKKGVVCVKGNNTMLFLSTNELTR